MSRGVAASPLSDAELTRAAQAGDAGSLGVLLARHEAGMRAVPLGMIGYGPDTDDVLQDAALVAVRRITDVRNPAAVGPWLRAVVRNECRMWLRSRHVGDRGGEILSTLPSEDPMPEDEVANNRHNAQVYQRLIDLHRALLEWGARRISHPLPVSAACGMPIFVRWNQCEFW